MMTRARAAEQKDPLADLGDAAGVRVGIVADTHGALDPRIAERLSGCDLLVHGGDVGAATVLEQLQAIAPRLLAVRGNNDCAQKWPAGERAWPARLPLVARVRLPGGELVVEHGDAYPARVRHARLRAAHGEARAVVYGHSHRLAVDRDSTPWLLNPGAAGRARTYGGPSCLLLEASTAEWVLAVVRLPLLAPARRSRARGKSL